MKEEVIKDAAKYPKKMTFCDRVYIIYNWEEEKALIKMMKQKNGDLSLSC